MPTISGLPAALTANLTGTSKIPATDASGETTGPTLAQVRTAMMAGSTGYTATDPITAGAASFTTIAGSGNLTIGSSTFVVTAATGNVEWSGAAASGTVSASAQFAFSRTLTTLGTGLHGIQEWTILNTAAAAGASGYASYDARATLTNTVAEDHFVGFQSRPLFNGSANLSYLAGVDVFPGHTGAGTIATAYGVKIGDVTGAGPITTNYGLYIAGATRGSTNWSLYVNNGDIAFGAGVSKTTAVPTGKQYLVSSTGDGANYAALQLVFSGHANAASRLFSLQTIEQGVANDGILRLQPNGGTLELCSTGVLATVKGPLTAVGAVQMDSTLNVTTSIAVNTKLFTFGANDSGGAGYRTVTIQNA